MKPGVSGTVTAVGSDTMANLMALWADGFKEVYPHVKFQLQASGSSTAPPALAEGTANLGPMSRKMTISEERYFAQKHGYRPTVIAVAMDAIVVFADADNPLQAVSVKQLDSIFSVTRFCGGERDISNWSQVNQQRSLALGDISLYGRNAVSGTYGMFKQFVLCGGDFKPNVKELPSSSSVIHSVAFSSGGLGYSAYGFQTAGVKMLGIQQDKEVVFPNEQTIASGQYPFSRQLYFIVNKPPDTKLQPLLREFILYILSEQGARITRREGYIPIPSVQTVSELEKLDAST
ncbi:MAG: PstS family phosphate ABC transporter substrate-binding protein [Aestuariibacter sp.]